MQSSPATQQPCLSLRVRLCCFDCAQDWQTGIACPGREHPARLPPRFSQNSLLQDAFNPDMRFHAGRKSQIESFAGANITYTIEAMMGDRRALQVCQK